MKGKCGNEDCRMSREERKRRREKTMRKRENEGERERENVIECWTLLFLASY
jgi:hypothetical protein